MTSPPEWTISPYKRSFRAQIPEIWKRRHLFLSLGTYAILRAYQKAILGVVWLAIRPMVMVAGATLVVRDILGVTTGAVPYPVYVLLSLVAWFLFQRGMTWTTKSMPTSRRILTNQYFPRLIVHFSNISPSFVEFLVISTFFVILATYYSFNVESSFIDIGWHTLLLLPCLLLIILFVLGLSCVTGLLNLAARDTWYTLRYILTAWMLVTPVFYPLSAIPEEFRTYMLLNPMAPLLLGVRWSLFHIDPMPWPFFALSVCVVLVTLAAGLWFFMRWESWAVDRI